ncbi:MAG TPA: phosphotransferase [Micromonosporaceae bacterium]
MDDELDVVRALLPGARVEVIDLLGGSNRSVVRRIHADAHTLIVKQFTGTDEGWARESAALSVLPAEVRAPRLVAAGEVPPTVVMSDVGSGASVADALLGPDPVAATEAVVAWATAIAGLHRATADLRSTFRDALDARAGDQSIAESMVTADLEDAARTLAAHAAELGVDVPADALAELVGLGKRLGGDRAAALTPADACPDNNVRTADGLVLIDFEGAQWRHVAWDVAYLIVPWPSCWCAWRIPAEVAEQAMAAYRVAAGMSDVDAAGLRRDVEAAAVGWAFISTSWFLPRALSDDPPLTNPSKPAPHRRAMILHRLEQARRSADLPALADLAACLHRALTARWGEVVLPYAPAFEHAGARNPTNTVRSDDSEGGSQRACE